MKLHEEFTLWENLWDLTALVNQNKLSEKWTAFDTERGPVKLWHSSSAPEFRAFLLNASSAGIKGLRICIANDLYLAARASELNHEDIIGTAEDNYLFIDAKEFECASCGFSKISDFDNDNYERKDATGNKRSAFAKLEAEDLAEYAKLAGKPIIDPKTKEVLWTHDGKQHSLVADCGTFEVSLYLFYSEQFPQFKYGDTDVCYTEHILFEQSNTYAVLKPLIKRLYMTNL